MSLPSNNSGAESSRPGFFSDLIAGLMMWDLWRTFAWDEIQQRYRRSILGVLWIIVSYTIFVIGISIFFSIFTRADAIDFLIYVSLGFAAFTFILSNIIDGCQVFISSRIWIISVSLPYSIYVYRSIFRSVFTFILQLIVALIIMIYAGWRPGPMSLMAMPALLLYLINAVAIQFFWGMISARYRDIVHFVGSLTRLLFFITPILWVREELTGIRAQIADINPLTHFIEILRAPLMGVEPRLSSWMIVLCLTAANWLLAFIATHRVRRRLAYWL
ncbi:MAG: ABC transporter permease [Maricaulaceae bacterium]|nr:ABC transporter permease [Maricaulaceae bacterium]